MSPPVGLPPGWHVQVATGRWPLPAEPQCGGCLFEEMEQLDAGGTHDEDCLVPLTRAAAKAATDAEQEALDFLYLVRRVMARYHLARGRRWGWT